MRPSGDLKVTSVTKMSGPLAEAHAAERRQVTLRRLRWAAALSFAPIAVSAVVNALVFSDRLAERLVTHAVQAAICAAIFVLAHGRLAEQRAILLAGGLLLGIGTSLFWSLSLSPRDLDVLVSPIACTMLASTLLFPWGARVQAIVSAYLAVGYFSVLASFALDPARLTNVLMGLTLGVVISVVGAWVLDRQRYATLVERERVATLADQRERLLEAGRELNGTLELSEVVQRIARHGQRLVGCDAASITLFDEGRQVFHTAALSGADPACSEELLGLEFPAVLARPFTDELVRRGTLEIPSGTPFDHAIEPITARFGFARTLYVAIQRDGRHLGFLNFSERPPARPFEEHRVRLAEGLAHQAAIALVNAQLVDELQTANRVKSEFLSTMSHELRTPLHVIMGYTEMVEDRDAEDWAVASAKIRGATRELLEMIEATLTLNRMESGKDGPMIDVVPVRQLWDELDGEFAALPRRPAVVLRWEPLDGVVLATDRRKLKTILKNLVGNALKFTTSGEVGVTCEVADDACVFRVRDTGVGISREHLPHIFEMFRQVDSSDRRSYGGVGLGLYIVRRLVEQLRGDIEVESEPGSGSTFTVTLPRTLASQPTLRVAS